MPYGGFEDGLYMAVRRSADKLVDHYGIVDIGNRMGNPAVAAGSIPVVYHQTVKGPRVDWVDGSSTWTLQERIFDEQQARDRLTRAFTNPKYDLLGNNCEHVAREVATGRRESKQLASAIGFATAVLATVAIVRLANE